VLDRGTGEMLSAEPFTTVNATTGVDLATGAVRRDDSHASRFATMTRDVCPGWPGAVGGASALAPDGSLLYIPVSRLCMDLEARNTSFIQGTAFVGANVREKSPADGMRGALVGWDLDAGRTAWSVREKFPVAGGVLTTGGVVFYGTLDGVFKALDGKSGHELWRFQASSGIIGQPISYRGPDGRPYVAVLAGLGGAFGTVGRHDPTLRAGTRRLPSSSPSRSRRRSPGLAGTLPSSRRRYGPPLSL
jgi:glucose dehydrogenase